MSTSRRAVTHSGWEVKTGMVRVWVTGKTVWSPCYSWAISEQFRDKGLIYKVLYKFSCLLDFCYKSPPWYSVIYLNTLHLTDQEAQLSRESSKNQISKHWTCGDRSGSTLVSNNEVNQRRARLVLEWVTMSGFNSQCRTFMSVCNQPPRSTQPGHPFVGRHNEWLFYSTTPEKFTFSLVVSIADILKCSWTRWQLSHVERRTQRTAVKPTLAFCLNALAHCEFHSQQETVKTGFGTGQPTTTNGKWCQACLISILYYNSHGEWTGPISLMLVKSTKPLTHINHETNNSMKVVRAFWTLTDNREMY